MKEDKEWKGRPYNFDTSQFVFPCFNIGGCKKWPQHGSVMPDLFHTAVWKHVIIS